MSRRDRQERVSVRRGLCNSLRCKRTAVPVRFSVINGCFQSSLSFSPTIRVAKSAPLPAEKPTIAQIGLFGNLVVSCAEACPTIVAVIAAVRTVDRAARISDVEANMYQGYLSPQRRTSLLLRHRSSIYQHPAEQVRQRPSLAAPPQPQVRRLRHCRWKNLQSLTLEARGARRRIVRSFINSFHFASLNQPSPIFSKRVRRWEMFHNLSFRESIRR